MKGKLIKSNGVFDLLVDNTIYAQLPGGALSSLTKKLSLKNCQAIENGYDLDELVENNYPTFNLPLTDITAINTLKQDSFKQGFQKAMELMEGKKFSEDDLKLAYSSGWTQRHNAEGSYYGMQKEFIQSLQQTEWEVEIEMEVVSDFDSRAEFDGQVFSTNKKVVPKLDKDGCLILRKHDK